MSVFNIFVLQMGMSIVGFSLIAYFFVVPWIKQNTAQKSLIALLIIHTFRHIGMCILVPGQTEVGVPASFAMELGYGDLITAFLAIASILALHRNISFAIVLVWITSIIGILDLVNVNIQAVMIDATQYDLGSVWYIATFFVPLLFISHYLIFWVLLNQKDLNS